MSAIVGETLVFGQHDGGPVELVVYGDEFYARYETKSGFTAVYDKTKGSYCYATLAAGRFTSTGTPIYKYPPAGLRRHLKESPEVRNERFGQRYDRIRPAEPPHSPHASFTMGPENGLLTGRRVSEGKVKGLTILVDFDDIQSAIPKEDVEAMLNADVYTRNGNACSVRRYFLEISSGKLEYTNVVVGPVKLGKRRSHYIDTLLVEEALLSAIEIFGINLADFDSRGEGVVDALNIMYAGRSQYSGELWPHNSVKEIDHDGIRTHFYQLTGLGRVPIDLSIGTFCHENGHLLCRFPDMYDYGKRDGDFEKSQGIGSYCLMGSGNHLNSGRTPSPVCGYLRDLVGWADRKVSLNDPGFYETKHGDYRTVMKYRTEKENEYFIVENRNRQGFDLYLPASGLAIYHCDTLGSNEWQEGTRNRHYQCALVQADGHLDLEGNRNPGDSGDLFQQKDGVAVSHDTVPSTREWDDSDSGMVVRDISAPGDSISFGVGLTHPSGQLKVDTSPDLLIPDKDERGVDSVITVNQPGSLRRIAVEVDIIHSWISDLEITLHSPSGRKVTLHQRTGHDTDDIRTTYTVDTTPELGTLEGESVQGKWKLHLVDHAKRDVGRLNRWGLDFQYTPIPAIAEQSVSPNAAIPDADPAGVASEIELSGAGSVKDVEVRIDIEHPFSGDLTVDLRTPSGKILNLHRANGWPGTNLKRTFTRETTPDLARTLDEAVGGTWRLEVRDIFEKDEGTLKSWALKVTPRT